MKKISISLFQNYSYNESDYKDEYNDELCEDQRKVLSLHEYITTSQYIEYEGLMIDIKHCKNNDSCIVIGELGLWNGKRKVLRKFQSLHEAIQTCFSNMDNISINQVNGHLELECQHHDGSNKFTIHLLNEKGINTINGNLSKKHYHRAIKGYLF